MAQDPEFTKFKRNLSTARREITRAVERFAEIDPREGHRAEAARRARAAYDAANELVLELERR
jgi:hypothetical protein